MQGGAQVVQVFRGTRGHGFYVARVGVAHPAVQPQFGGFTVDKQRSFRPISTFDPLWSSNKTRGRSTDLRNPSPAKVVVLGTN